MLVDSVWKLIELFIGLLWFVLVGLGYIVGVVNLLVVGKY